VSSASVISATPAIGEGHATRALSLLGHVAELSDIRQLAETIGARLTT